MEECLLNLREWFTPTGNLLLGLGTFILAIVAIFGDALKLKAAKEIEKETYEGKIRHEQFQNKLRLAKEAIQAFNRIREDIRQIRSIFGFEGEVNGLQDLEEKNDLITSMKKNSSAGLTLLRMDKKSDSFAEINKLEPEFRAVFGQSEAFAKVHSAKHEIWVAAQEIMDAVDRQKNKKIIYASSSNDEIANRIDDAVKEIEEICQPILKGKE